MKKTLSLILSALMLSTAAIGCAPAQNQLDPAITLASSDALANAQWLDERLETIPNEIVVGIGSDENYGIDMSDFQDDGYILRSMGDEVVAFGKTADGLDRAVRAYAKAVESGQTGGFNTAYNEGYRVKKLTIAGRDISEYVIRLAADADECHTFAAAELQSFIGKACGFYPEIVTVDKAHMIVLEQVLPEDERYEVLGDEGFTFTVKENGDLYITGGQYRGCLFGVYEFLEKYIGWRFLYDYNHVTSYAPNYMEGCIDFLYEAEHIDIPAELDETQTPRWDTRYTARNAHDYGIRQKANYVLSGPKYNGYGIAMAASHGLMRGPYKDFFDFDPTYMTQPCFTNEESIQIAQEYYANLLQSKLDAGQKVGREIVDFDVSQNDNGDFCKCKECMKLARAEGGNVGPVLHFTNLIADAVAEIDPNVYVLMLVYSGTTTVPRTLRPRDNVSGAYCYYDDIGRLPCYSHPIDGSRCNGNLASSWDRTVSNAIYADELRGWDKICNRLQVWYYPGIWNCTAMSSPFLHNLYYDMKFIGELENVIGVCTCPSGCEIPAGYIRPEEMIAPYLISNMTWNPDITIEEYYDLVREYYYIMCGDGYEELFDYYFDLQLRCATGNCWATKAYMDPTDRIKFAAVRDNFDEMVSLFDTARRLAQTKWQEDYVEKLSQTMYFTGLCASHTQWYLEGDSESRAKYEEYYNEFKTVALEHGFDFYGFDEPHIFITEEDFDIEKNLGRLIVNDVTDFCLSEDWYLYE